MWKKLLRPATNLRYHLQRRRNGATQCDSESIENTESRVEIEHTDSNTGRVVGVLKNLTLEPYDVNTWQQIKSLGQYCDQQLKLRSIPLTIGSEPTYIDASHQNESEWIMQAMSNSKRDKSYQLAKNLKTILAPMGILVYELGKWCAGEEIPRWSINVYWFSDQKPLFAKQSLLANEEDPGIYGSLEAEHFAKKLIINLAELKDKKGTSFPDTKVLFQYESDYKDTHLFCPRLYSKKNNAENLESCARVEFQAGKITVFIPRFSHLNDYLEFLQTVENTAAELQYAVILQGYGPPEQSEISKLSITPDPGVLEVNLPPKASFVEIAELYEILAEECSKLSLQGFRSEHKTNWLDNKIKLKQNINSALKISATGGGNHITLGGANLENNPFLKRPDLLQSLCTYWQHHPALSYLFSGEYLGTTSQAPRLDEGRRDNLYDLELAFQELNKQSELSPKIIHDILKNFLVDITGNAHRSEFCIDKFYLQESDTRRMQGLLELRAFEMQAHAHSNLIMILLVIALVCKFWDKPYPLAFIQFGMRLLDEYLLPHFIWQDMTAILNELQRDNYPFIPEWFTPFFETKFTLFGTFFHEKTEIEIRKALEPTPVLGQEMSSGFASRTVDPAIKRLQIKLSNYSSVRYNLICNDIEVPLQCVCPIKNEFLLGIRYKACNPMITAHPTIAVQTPLRFHLIDKISKKIMLAFELDNVCNVQQNTILRSQAIKFYKKPCVHPDFPYTLDLRYQN